MDNPECSLKTLWLHLKVLLFKKKKKKAKILTVISIKYSVFNLPWNITISPGLAIKDRSIYYQMQLNKTTWEPTIKEYK